MTNLKMGKKGAPTSAAKKLEKIHSPTVSKRISDFLIEEGKKEKTRDNPKRKIARPNTFPEDLDI